MINPKDTIQLSAQVSSINTVAVTTTNEDLHEAITSKQWCVGTYKPREDIFPQLSARESNRRNEFFVGTPSIFAVDIDNTYTKKEIAYPELTMQEAALRLEELGLAYLIAPTANHKKLKKGHEEAGQVERYRVILWLDKGLTTIEEHKAVFTWLKKEVFPEMDRQCSDPARFYNPSTSVTYIWLEGEPLATESIVQAQLTAIDAQLKMLNRTSLAQKDSRQPPILPQRIPKYVQDVFVFGLSKESGERNNTLHKVCQWLAKEQKLSEKEVLDKVLDIGLKAGLEEEEIRAMARSSMNTKVEFTLDPQMNGPLFDKLVASRLIYNVDDSSDIVFMYDEQAGSYESFDMSVVPKIFPKEVQPLIKGRTTAAKLVYEPFTAGSRFIYADGIKEIFHKFNTYCHPEWRLKEIQQSSDQLPALYDKFFKHLVKEDAPSYEYLLDWLANAIRDRNFTVLCAIASEEGTGKGVLGIIMSNLVGESNYNKVRDEVFKNKFNKGLKNKRIVQLDEVKLKGDEELNRFKDIINTSVEIEAKGKDAELMKNYASFYLTSNNIDAIRPSASDRRFSIIEMTDIKLLRAFSQKEIDQLTLGVDIAKLGWFLLNRELKNNMLTSFKSAHYEHIREASQSMWQEYMLEDFAKQYKNKDVPLKKVQQLLREEFGPSFNIGRIKLKAFCDDYKEYFQFKQANGLRTVTPIKAKFDNDVAAVKEQSIDLFASAQDNERILNNMKSNSKWPRLDKLPAKW